MKKIIRTVAAVAVIASMTGCATPYMTDRRRDAADIFTCTFGEGVGTKARVGPVAVGLLANSDTCGFRNGYKIVTYHDRWDVPSYEFHMFDVTVTLLGGERADLNWWHMNKNDRFKSYEAATYCGISFISPGWTIGPPLISTNAPWQSRIPYYTQIEVVGGLVGTCRLGFNPGELLDFLLGWTTIDIFKDDLETKKQKDKSNQLSEATR